MNHIISTVGRSVVKACLVGRSSVVVVQIKANANKHRTHTNTTTTLSKRDEAGGLMTTAMNETEENFMVDDYRMCVWLTKLNYGSKE